MEFNTRSLEGQARGKPLAEGPGFTLKIWVSGFRSSPTFVIHAGSEALPQDACLHGFGNRPKSGYAATCERATVFGWCSPCVGNESATPHGDWGRLLDWMVVGTGFWPGGAEIDCWDDLGRASHP
jgi:hypothetical protein